MDDFVINVRQVAQYPAKHIVGATDALLLQESLGGAYRSIQANELVASALLEGGFLMLATGDGIVWADRASLTYTPGSFVFSDLVTVPSLNAIDGLFDAGQRVATQCQFDWLKANSLTSFNGRVGAVQLEEVDILRAGAAPVNNPHFTGWVTAPTPWDTRKSDDTVATTAWVQQAVCAQISNLLSAQVVVSFNGRFGAVTLTVDDVNSALLGAQSPDWPRSVTPPFGDASTRIATTLFVDESVEDLRAWTGGQIDDAIAAGIDLSGYAPLASPAFSGVPTAPTAAVATSTGQIATTAFVHLAVTAATTGVSSFNTRTGAVVLLAADLTAAGGALLASPAFTGIPTAPTASPGNSTTEIATTAFVAAAIAGVAIGVASFNTRTGAVTLTAADVTGSGAFTNAALLGTPTAPTAAPGNNTTAIATTAFVTAALAAQVAGVASFNGRTGIVSLQGNDISGAGGALVNSPTFTGTPTAPTPPAADNTTKLATTAFVTAAITASAAGVASFNGRTGAVVLTLADVTGTGVLANTAHTGVPTAPTAGPGTSTTQLATCAFVAAAIAAAGGVTSFNSRAGNVNLTTADVTGTGVLSNTALLGVPTAPTATAGTNSTQLATTAFVAAALAINVSSFNTRTGAVTLQANDVSGVGGALLASPALTGTPTAPTASPGNSTTQLATTAFVAAAVSTGAVVSFNTRTGAVVLTLADVTATGILNNPGLTGTPTAPTAGAGVNTTQIATTAFVTAAVNASVLSFNGRSGAVSLSLADVTGTGVLNNPALAGTPTAPTAAPGTNTGQVATTSFVAAAVAAATGVASFNTRTGAITLTLADVTATGVLNNTALTGVPTAPTAAPGVNTTQLATCAFVAAAAAAAGVTSFNTRTGAITLTLADVTATGVLNNTPLTGVPTVPTAAASTNTTQAASTAFVESEIAAKATSAIVAYWGGTVVITALGQNVNSNSNATGIIGFASAHGIVTGQVVQITGTSPAALPVNQAWYARALSITTIAFYPTLADAKADTNRVMPTGATASGWSVRTITYSGVVSKNFDPVAPIGFVTSQGAIRPELNLSAALPQTVNAMVFLQCVNGLFDNEATATVRNAWYNNNTPAVINSTLIRLDSNWAVAVGAAGGVFGPGTWAGQGQNNFYLGLSIIA